MGLNHTPLSQKLVADGLDPNRHHRPDTEGPIRLMAKAEGWVLVRRDAGLPFVMREADWLNLGERAA